MPHVRPPHLVFPSIRLLVALATLDVVGHVVALLLDISSYPASRPCFCICGSRWPGACVKHLVASARLKCHEHDDGIDGPPRVWLGHMDVPGLAMSRSLGDAVAHTAGVLSEPEFTSRWLDKSDRCLIVDGLWEFMSNEECMEIAMGQRDPKVAVDLLIKEANRRWMKEEQVSDDITIIVAYIDTGGSKKASRLPNN
ncbi:unnamed protein product [Peronospora destructor]|uniref:PPM-type phosphatase domain-containing protein n=1 Tax=Peronospora destructor TaxID=86335 RepID=A0AAV0TMT9_9STRA|nr:unnamed protein product [Peronospora destructor]